MPRRSLRFLIALASLLLAASCAAPPAYDPEPLIELARDYHADLLVQDPATGPHDPIESLKILTPLPVHRLPEALAALREPEDAEWGPELRIGALLALTIQEPPVAIDPRPHLARALQDANPEVRLVALRGLRHCVPLPVEYADQLRPLIASDDYMVRHEAGSLLLEFGPELLPALEAWALSASDEVREQLPYYAANIPGERSTRLLGVLLNDTSPTVRNQTINVLSHPARRGLNGPLVPAFLAALEGEDITLARGAIEALALLDLATLREHLPELQARFCDPLFEPGYEIGRLFQALGPAAEPALFAALKHADPTVRRRACDTIISFQLGSPRVSARLLEVSTTDRDADVRLRAWDALAETDADYQKEDTPLYPPGWEEYEATRTEPTPPPPTEIL